jgi:hypothetical protein
LAVASECFVYGVIDHFENHVVKASAVIGVTDIHAGPLADRFQPFQNLNAAFVVDWLTAHKYSLGWAFILSQTRVARPQKRLFYGLFTVFHVKP